MIAGNNAWSVGRDSIFLLLAFMKCICDGERGEIVVSKECEKSGSGASFGTPLAAHPADDANSSSADVLAGIVHFVDIVKCCMDIKSCDNIGTLNDFGFFHVDERCLI